MPAPAAGAGGAPRRRARDLGGLALGVLARELVQLDLAGELGLDVRAGCGAAADLAGVLGDGLLDGEVVVAVQAAPPVGLLGVAHLRVDLCAADAALADELAVLVGEEVAGDLVDDGDEGDGGPAEAVDVGRVAAVVERGDGEVEGDGELVADDDEGEGEGEQEADGGVAEAADDAVVDAAVARLVVVDGVAEAVDYDEPGEEEEEGAGFEAAVCGLRLGHLDGLVGGALVGDGTPVARDGHEEVLDRSAIRK